MQPRVRLLSAVFTSPSARPGELIVLGLLLLAGSIAMSPNTVDPDLWGHVQYGRDMLHDGLARHTTHSWLARNVEWINHEILAELALALTIDTVGPVGLLVSKMLAGTVLLGTVLWRMRIERLSLPTCVISVLLLANGMARFWSCRPQLFSFLFYTLLLWLLGQLFSDWEGRWHFHRTMPGEPTIAYRSRALRWLWVVPGIMGIWTNTHGGFLAGECLYTAYLFLRGAELAWQRGWLAVGLLKRFALMIAVAWLATGLNPYGYRFHVWLWHDLAVPRPEIVEWLPPDFTQPEAWPFLMLIGFALISVLATRRALDATHGVLLGLTLWQSLAHERHIPFFAISCAFFLPRHLDDVLHRWKLVTTHSDDDIHDAFFGRPATPVSRPSVIRVVGCWCGIVLVLACCGFRLHDRLQMIRVPCDHYPVQAIEFMTRHGLQGRTVCAMNWAQYLLAALPGEPTAHLDGRLRTAYTQEMIDVHFDFLYGRQPASERYRDPRTPFDPPGILEKGYPDLVLIDRRLPYAVAVMEQHRHGWTLLYQDGLAQLWGRSTRYNDPRSPDYFPPSQRIVHDQLMHEAVAWPAISTPEPASLPKVKT